MNGETYIEDETLKFAEEAGVTPIAQRAADALMRRYIFEEALFVDETIRARFPRWLTRAAENEKMPGHRWIQAAIMTLAFMSGIRVVRLQHRDLKSGPGFRISSGIETLESVTVQVKRGKKVLAEKRIGLGIIIK